ncbi:hypothetical protein SO802_010319 [Lithocarpus litseifolius]|uniref:Uncharacterized protein n=1 Tax=Lithocarpus litseifolius TaxID=425828 RepID=A0AAW2DEF3_9ROSI
MVVPDIDQSNDALLIQVDLGMTAMCTFVPRQLNREQMNSIFPESWNTKYEMLHQATKPIHSNDHFFIKKANGEVKTKFIIAPPEKKDITAFPTQIAMFQPISYVCEDGLTIKAFREDGKPCYEGKSPFGHIWWDVCNCDDCQEEEVFEEDYSKRKKKSSQQVLKERYEAGDPEVDLLGEPSGKFDYYVLYPRTRKQKIPPSPCKTDHNSKPLLIPYYQKFFPQHTKMSTLSTETFTWLHV